MFHFSWLCVDSESLSSFFFLRIRRPPRSTLDRSSAASDVYKRQLFEPGPAAEVELGQPRRRHRVRARGLGRHRRAEPVSYTHLRAHETVLDLVCRLLLEKKKHNINKTVTKLTETNTHEYIATRPFSYLRIHTTHYLIHTPS